MRVITVLVVSLIAGTAGVASANTCNWTGAAANTNWSTVGNWSGCPAPVSGDTLVFPATPSPVTYVSVNDIPNLTPKAIVVSRTFYQISGLGVRLGGDALIYNEIVAPSPTPPAFLAPITLMSPLLITNAAMSQGSTFAVGDINLNGFALTLAYPKPQEIDVVGTISGSGSITLSAGGSLVLAKANSYTGQTVVQEGGRMTIHDAHALGATGVGSETLVTGGSLVIDAPSAITLDEIVAFAPDQYTSGLVSNTDVTFTTPITFGGATLYLADLFGGQHRFIFLGPLIGRTLQVIKNVTFTNPADSWSSLDIQAGVVTIGAAGALPQGAPISNLGTLDLNGFDTVTGPMDGCGPVLLGAATLTVTANAVQNALAFGPLIGTGTFVKAGAGVQGLWSGYAAACPETTAASFAGTVVVNQGRLALASGVPNVPAVSGPILAHGGTVLEGGAGALSDRSQVTLDSGATWALKDQTVRVGALTGAGAVSLGTGTLIVTGTSSTTFSGVINSGTVTMNGVSLERTGTGSLTLTGQNTYTGRTVVSGGSLIVNGTIGGTMSVDGGTLGGVGTIGSINPVALNATSTGAVSPGNSPGILHTGMLRLVSGLTFTVDMNGPAAGVGYDQLDVNGDVLLAEPILKVTRRFGPPVGAQFTIVRVAGGHTVKGTFAGLPESASLELNGQHFGISYKGGDGNDVVLTSLEPPPPATYYLSEGATGPFFDEDILIANPNTTAAPVTLTFSKEDGSQVTATQSVPPQARVTVHVDQVPGLEATAASAEVRSEQGVPLLVERTMFWDATYYAGHTGSAVDQPAPDWFFAEGSQGFFNTFVLVINPNALPTDVTFTFLRESDDPVTKTIRVGAHTRLTLDCGSVPEIVNRSFGITVQASLPIMAERSMYFGTTPTRLWSGGTESAGVTSRSTHWFLAEGATGGFFDTFILLSNPNSDPAQVTMQYLLDSGDTISVSKVVPAHARLTTNLETEDDQRLHNAAVSTVVTSDQPIIAERSMYWPGAAVPWGEGHNSFGVVDAGLHWGLAEGRTGGPLNFHSYILLANPQPTAANVTVTFLRENGAAAVTKTFTVPPTSRFNIDTSTIPELQNESFGADIAVTNGAPIIVERSMYWDSNGFQFSGGTNATATRLP